MVYLYDALHFFLVDGTIAIDVVHGESPVEFLLGVPFIRGDVDGKKKLFELNRSTTILVE